MSTMCFMRSPHPCSTWQCGRQHWFSRVTVFINGVHTHTLVHLTISGLGVADVGVVDVDVEVVDVEVVDEEVVDVVVVGCGCCGMRLLWDVVVVDVVVVGCGCSRCSSGR